MKHTALLIVAALTTVALAVTGCAGAAEAQEPVPAVAAPIVAPAPATQRDPAMLGRALFLQCAACHALTAVAPPKIGPHLEAILGRQAGSVEGFAYSAAMRGSGIAWTREQLDQFLARPANLVPGTSMAFGGLESEAQRSAIIAYLETLD